jgi:hypothetical protein
MPYRLGPRCFTGAFGLLVVGALRSARAATAEPVPVDLRYVSSDGCPTRSVVVEELAARGMRIDSGATSSRLSIEIRGVPAEQPSLRGELVVGAPNWATASREVVGQDCNAVVLSLVLVAALALSPPEGAAPPSSLAKPEAPAVNERPQPTWLFGVSGRAMTGLAPELSWGVGVSAERAWGSGKAAASVAFSAAAFAPANASVPAGSANFRGYLGRLAACWLGAGLDADRVHFSPCAGLEGGAIVATGSIASPLTVTRPWLAPQMGARVVVGVTRGVWLSAGGSVFIPLVRDTFVFKNPDVTIYRAPAIGAGAELEVAGAFW